MKAFYQKHWNVLIVSSKTKINLILRDIQKLDSYLITTTKNYGNDIAPFILIYNYLITNDYNYNMTHL